MLPNPIQLERGVRVLRQLVDELDDRQTAGSLFELVALGSPSFAPAIGSDEPVDHLGVDEDDEVAQLELLRQGD